MNNTITSSHNLKLSASTGIETTPASQNVVGRSFSEVTRLLQSRPEHLATFPPQISSNAMQLAESFKAFNREWNAAQGLMRKRIERLPRDSRELFQLQEQMQNLQLKSQLVTVAGEAISSTVKRVQQMGNS